MDLGDYERHHRREIKGLLHRFNPDLSEEIERVYNEERIKMEKDARNLEYVPMFVGKKTREIIIEKYGKACLRARVRSI